MRASGQLCLLACHARKRERGGVGAVVWNHERDGELRCCGRKRTQFGSRWHLMPEQQRARAQACARGDEPEQLREVVGGVVEIRRDLALRAAVAQQTAEVRIG